MPALAKFEAHKKQEIESKLLGQEEGPMLK